MKLSPSLRDIQFENQFLYLSIIQELSLLGCGFFGITNDQDLLNLVKFLVRFADKGHATDFNHFKVMAAEILKNILYELAYDHQLNASKGFEINKVYPNFDEQYEDNKKTAIAVLNKYL